MLTFEKLLFQDMASSKLKVQLRERFLQEVKLMEIRLVARDIIEEFAVKPFYSIKKRFFKTNQMKKVKDWDK